MARGLRAVARLRGCGAIPYDTSHDAVLHQLNPLLRRSFEVECLRQPTWIERVVCDRDLLVEDLLAEAGR